jgi:DNA primase
MRFPPTFIEEIKARLPVSEVVRRRVKLTKAGREWKGLSPFSPEKTPSFTVNDQKGFYHCFSSGNHGNIFDFVMETEGLSFPEAVERLAGDAGLALPVVTQETEAQEKKRASLHDLLEAATVFFEARLQDRGGTRARAYLETRGLTLETQRKFRLGYSPSEKYTLRDHLAGKGFPVEAMAEAGLLIHGEDIPVPYESFRDRLMFPIADRSGRIIAFGGRTLEKDGQPKYKNSPETPLFHKGSVLYNHHVARKCAHELGAQATVIVVEGYVDVISMAQAGVGNCVAPLGTALTPDQCALLWKMAEEPVLCFDGDKAGRKAAYRALDMALPYLGEGRSLRFALLPEGQDPDDLARSGGAAAIQAVIANALPLVDVIWMRETEGGAFATPERRAGLHRRLSELTRAIPDETLRHYYQADFKNRLTTFFGGSATASPAKRFFEKRPFEARGTGGQRFQRAGEQASFASPPSISSSLASSPLFRTGAMGLPPREALILLLLLKHPGLIEAHLEELVSLDFSTPEAVKLIDTLLGFADAQPPESTALETELRAAGFGAFLDRLGGMSALASHWYLDPGAAEADAGEVLKQALTLHRKTRALHRELQLAELALGNDTSEPNLARLKDIQEQLAALSGVEAVVEGFGTLSGRLGGGV